MSVETIIQTRRTNKFVDRIIMIAASAHAPALGALTFVGDPEEEARRIVEEYADGLREILKKPRKLLN